MRLRRKRGNSDPGNPNREAQTSGLGRHRIFIRPFQEDWVENFESSESVGVLVRATDSIRATGGEPLPKLSVDQFIIEDLCREIRGKPELGSLPIDDMYRCKMPTGLRHEFILIRTTKREGRHRTWIRIDRAAKGGWKRFTFAKPVDDTVSHDINIRGAYEASFAHVFGMSQARMGSRGKHRLMAGESRLRAHIVFKPTPRQPQLLTLASLLTIMHEESTHYKLLSVRVQN